MEMTALQQIPPKDSKNGILKHNIGKGFNLEYQGVTHPESKCMLEIF